jgi:hypothetical protein
MTWLLIFDLEWIYRSMSGSPSSSQAHLTTVKCGATTVIEAEKNAEKRLPLKKKREERFFAFYPVERENDIYTSINR